MTSNVLDQATRLYVFVDDFLKAHPELAHWRRSNNDDPAFTDAEVLAIGLMQGSLGVATLRKTHEMIRDNVGFAFPRLPGYKQWVRRLHALVSIAGRLVEAAFVLVALSSVRLYLLDAKPVPVCKPIRHGRVRLMREDGAYFGKTSAGWFFGFKLHVGRMPVRITHVSGAVMAAALTPGNWDDRPVAPALGAQTAGGIALGDAGYGGAEFFEGMLDESGVAVVTPRDAVWGSDEQRMLSGVRERVETTLRQLWDRFCDRVYARSWIGLWSVSLLKLVHLNLCYAGIASI